MKPSKARPDFQDNRPASHCVFSIITRDGRGVFDLSRSARIGVNSVFNKSLLLQIRQDLKVVVIEETIQELWVQLNGGVIDAVVVSSDDIMNIQPDRRMVTDLSISPYPLQGG